MIPRADRLSAHVRQAAVAFPGLSTPVLSLLFAIAFSADPHQDDFSATIVLILSTNTVPCACHVVAAEWAGGSGIIYRDQTAIINQDYLPHALHALSA